MGIIAGNNLCDKVYFVTLFEIISCDFPIKEAGLKFSKTAGCGA